MPPLRSVRSCSPSARARTVTAHSLNAIGITKMRGRDTARDVLPAGPEGHAQREAGFYAHRREIPKTRTSPGVFRGTKRRCVIGKALQRGAGVALEHLDHGGEVVIAVPA